MGWYKIELSAHQMANNETAKLQSSFDNHWKALGHPKGFALFRSKRSGDTVIIYISPLAASECELLIRSYNGSFCDPPSSDEAGLLLGFEDDKALLA